MPLRVAFKSNIPQISRKIAALRPQQDQGLMAAASITVLNVLRDSKTVPPRVPVDTGALQSTGFTEPAKMEGRKIVAAVGYGGIASRNVSAGGVKTLFKKAVDYAIFVHDNLNGRIKNYKRPGSGAKFLEFHWNKRIPEFKEKAEAALGKAYNKL